MPKSLCLSMIVRNECARIERALKSIAPYINCWVIVDTGSTDNTLEIIQKFFTEQKIPGFLGRTEFKDFSEARNVALEAARKSPVKSDYIILMDADMELQVKDPAWRCALPGNFALEQPDGRPDRPRAPRRCSTVTAVAESIAFLRERRERPRTSLTWRSTSRITCPAKAAGSLTTSGSSASTDTLMGATAGVWAKTYPMKLLLPLPVGPTTASLSVLARTSPARVSYWCSGTSVSNGTWVSCRWRLSGLGVKDHRRLQIPAEPGTWLEPVIPGAASPPSCRASSAGRAGRIRLLAQ